MFKINYINHERIDTLRNVSGVIGNSFHASMEIFYTADTVEKGIEDGLKAGHEYLAEYEEGFIEYSTTVKNKQKAADLFTFLFNSYVAEKGRDESEEIVAIEPYLEHDINVEWKGEIIELPVKLKGYIDKVVRKEIKGEKRLVVKDYKTTRAFSNPDKIDGKKILQSIMYFFLAYAEYGEAPYSMVFEEVKMSKNRDGSPQLREYEIVYEENEQFFDFFFRFYDDVTRAINGEAVFVPNLDAFYDNEVALVSYIHRLDVDEEQAKQLKKLQVSNITDLLKSKIEHASNMKSLMEIAGKKFTSIKSLNYDNMPIEKQIATKLMEHSLLLKYDSKVDGYAVDLFKYKPSQGQKMTRIEKYVKDVEQATGIANIRILAPIPNTRLVGFEVPRVERRFPEGMPEQHGYEFHVGVDVMGEAQTFDIREAPHVLIAGATGSGKSVMINSLLKQFAAHPDFDLHLYDPKMVELARFKKDAKEHFTEADEIYLSLSMMVDHMNDRYNSFVKVGAANLQEFHKITGNKDMKYKIVCIDEFGDLTTGGSSRDEVNLPQKIQELILKLAQKSRAAGIHMIISTQRPSVKIINGDIKANFVTKIALQTTRQIDSEVIMGHKSSGAEKLLGKGDMIFAGNKGEMRLQGYYV